MVDNYIGEIRVFAGDFAPVGWHFCDGTQLAISGNEALYSLLGTSYGGDGQASFALPDLRGRLPLGIGQSGQTGSNLAIGQKVGTEFETLTSSQLPTHNHSFVVSTVAGTSNSPENSAFNVGPQQSFNATAESAQLSQMNSASISNTGANQPHENRMPFTALNYIIATTGIYPTPE